MPRRKKRGGSSRVPGGSSRLPAGSMSVPGGSLQVPGGRLRPKGRRHRSVPARQGRLQPRHAKGSRYKHGAHFLGGSLSEHDAHRVFSGAQNSFYPALNRSNLRHINYSGIKHAAIRGSVI